MNVLYSNSCCKEEKVVVETRTFLPKHYLFPIPDEDVRRNPKMVQNLGWTTE